MEGLSPDARAAAAKEARRARAEAARAASMAKMRNMEEQAVDSLGHGFGSKARTAGRGMPLNSSKGIL